MKTCRRCFKPQEESEFGVNNYFDDRKAIYCKSCNREHMRKQRAHARVLLTTTKVKVYAILNLVDRKRAA